jgi:bifunctional non-homologous end joining protein LigD
MMANPQFYDLMRRRKPVHFAAFDLLWLNGKDLRWLPLLERKRILRGIVPPQPAPIFYVDHIDARGVDLYRCACESDLEGVVAQLKRGVYNPAATTWVKIKNRH